MKQPVEAVSPKSVTTAVSAPVAQVAAPHAVATPSAVQSPLQWPQSPLKVWFTQRR